MPRANLEQEVLEELRRRKIRSLVPGWCARVPFRQGAQEIVDWHDADPARRRVDARLDALYDRLVESHRVHRR